VPRPAVAEEPRPASPPEIFDNDLAAPSHSPSKVQQQFEKYPFSIWVRATIVFRTHFPEYGYLHPDESESPIDVSSDHHKLKLMALLALTARYPRQEITDIEPEHHHFIVSELQRCLTDSPSLSLVQAYHLMGLWEWGEGHTYPAWIYAGLAIRMLQSLLATKYQVQLTLPQPCQSMAHGVTEVESRTFWSCALLDKQVSNGIGRAVLLSLREPIPPFPTSDDDFIFGPLSAPALGAYVSTHHGAVDFPTLRNLDLRMLAVGMNIWSKIHQWVALGGRKQPGMVNYENSPWRPTSQWAKMREELRLWRDAHHTHHKYPETSIMAHAYLHQAAPVVHLNLVYYLR
jgi:hypothetical protein